MNAYLKLLWLSLTAFLSLGAEGEDDDAGDADTGADGGDVAGADDDDAGSSLDDVLAGTDLDEAPPARRAEPKETPKEREYRERAERAESAARAAPAPAPHTPQGDPLDAQEDAWLTQQRNAGATAEQMQQAQWAVNQQRALRRNTSELQQVRRESRDAADRAEFQALKGERPKLIAAYEKRVNEFLQGMQSRGESAPRRAILQLLIGQDLIEGKLKPARARPAADTTTRVDRGRTGMPRSDVGAKAGKNNREALRKRLDGVNI